MSSLLFAAFLAMFVFTFAVVGRDMIRDAIKARGQR